MPKRFPSLKGRRTTPKAAVIDPPEYFDFDYRSSPPHSAQQAAIPRPSTAGGYRLVPAEVIHDRPRTADRPVDRRLETTKVTSDWIGLAIGSPTHPPTSWADSVSPISPQHAFREEGPFPTRQDTSWKKIGDLLKPRTITLKYTQTRTIPSEHTINTASRTQGQYDAAVLEYTLSNSSAPPPPPKTSADAVKGSDIKQTSTPTPLPQLEIVIPRVELDRYSVMFKDVVGVSTKEPSIPKRKPVGDMNHPKQSTEHKLQPQPSPRRSTNPSMSKVQYRPFPSLSTHPLKQNPSQHSERMPDHQLRRRSVSTPASLDTTSMQHSSTVNPSCMSETMITLATEEKAAEALPAPPVAELPTTRSPVADDTIDHASSQKSQMKHKRTETADSAKPKPLMTRRVLPVESNLTPEDAPPDDEDDFPWRSAESPCSSASSRTSVDEEEIFFDLRPIKDSTGVRNSQYVVINPDADAVELARSVSLKNKKKQQGKESSPEAQRYQWTPEMLPDSWATPPAWGMPPDLQAAEHFCMSSDRQAAQPALRLSMFDKAIAEVEKLASPSEPNWRQQPGSANISSQYIQVPLQAKGLAIGIPSPIAERSCEGTPIVDTYPTLQPPSRHIATQVSSSPTIIVSRLSTTSGIPPPVPRKDSKFLVQSQTGASTKAHHLKRKDSLTARSQPRPSTRVNPHESTAASSRAYEYRESTSRHRRSIQKTKIPSTNTSRHRQEVSVARTISLTRKASHKVFVSRQGGSDSTINQSIRVY